MSFEGSNWPEQSRSAMATIENLGNFFMEGIGLTTPNQPRADKRHAARRLPLEVSPLYDCRATPTRPRGRRAHQRREATRAASPDRNRPRLATRACPPRVEAHAIERARVAQRAKQWPVEDRPEIDAPLGPVAEHHAQRVRPNDGEASDAMDGMVHGAHRSGSISDGRSTGLQEVPVGLQFSAVNLSPGLDEAPLREWQGAAQALDRVEREHRGVLLMVRVEMGAMMGAARLDEHSDYDAKEPRQLRHDAIVACGSVFFVVGLTRSRPVCLSRCWSGDRPIDVTRSAVARVDM